MASMSLEFILCEPEGEPAPRTRKQSKKKAQGSSAALQDNHENTPSGETNNQNSGARRHAKGDRHNNMGSKTTPALDRQQHVRRLQNLRQRRYRERKKSTASALQTNAEQLHQENEELETAILEHFKSQM